MTRNEITTYGEDSNWEGDYEVTIAGESFRVTACDAYSAERQALRKWQQDRAIEHYWGLHPDLRGGELPEPQARLLQAVTK